MSKPVNSAPGARYIVFTDMDGTLLDSRTYSFRAARPALELLARRHIPLILTSSKTRPEIEVYRRRLGNREAFIAENGGAVFVPRRGFNLEGFQAKRRGQYLVIELGTPYRELTLALAELRRALRLEIVGFSEMSAGEVAGLTGLPRPEAALAKRRQFDEPFTYQGDSKGLARLRRAARRRGLTVTPGGRFHHLKGKCDKGRAAAIVKEIYRRRLGEPLVAIGLGDGGNDLPMLRRTEHPVLVKRAEGGYTRTRMKGLRRTLRPGPAGFKEAIFDILKGGRNG